MPDKAKDLFSAIKRDLQPTKPDLRTPAQAKKDQAAKMQQGQKQFQEKITGQKMSDAQYKQRVQNSDARMKAKAEFQKKNNANTDQSYNVLKLRAEFPKELHELLDSSLYIRQKGITPISNGTPGDRKSVV